MKNGKVLVRSFERGLLFRDGEFKGVLEPGTHWFFSLTVETRVDVVSMRDPWLKHIDLDLIIASGALKDQATVVDLKDKQRGLVWLDGRFLYVLMPGRYVYWHGFREVRVETVDATPVRFEHPEQSTILNSSGASTYFETLLVPEGFAGLYLRDGKYVETLAPGRYACWRGMAQLKLQTIDLREQVLDVSGQELMSADKVTLRMNTLVTYRVIDPLKATNVADDVKQALYREVQLALRAVVGTRPIDALLEDKDGLAQELDTLVRRRADDFGLMIETVGIRDIILPGDMRDLLNKVTKAKKAAEANLITRREETAAMRSQVNTAKLMENNPILMRLRELEALEKVADKGKLQVVLGERGLADRVVNSI